jgi:diguanylate cyclase (GGDEF)-like protein/PAS domain S-box-containing protein
MGTTRNHADRAPGPTDEVERAVLDQLYEGVYFVDPARRIRYWNAGAERLSGFTAEQITGRFCHDNLLNHVDARGRSLCRSRCPLAATMVDGRKREADVYLRHRMGHRVQVRVRTSPVRDREGRIVGGVEVFDDTADIRQARHEISSLRSLAMTDALTQVPNRRHFEMTLASRVGDLAGYGRPFGLLIADIDHFKRLNDQYGHAVGDVALRTVAATLLEGSRAMDNVARIGGEEFGITVADADEAALLAVAERLRVLVARSAVRSEGLDLRLTVSIGGAAARAGETAETIFRRADAALYEAKEQGRNRVLVAGA